MKALQYIYTSWKNGTSANKGYMIYSKSDGIQDEECDDIKSIMQYMVPKNLKLNPTQEEIEEYFPFSFAYFKLSTGRGCVANTKYLGKDYSGRYGNYIIYALVFEIDEMTMYPVELFAENYIKTYMTEDELNANSPVPPLEPKYIREYGNIINDDLINEFIEEREEEFAYLLSALLQSKKDKKPLFIHDTRENLVLWMASIQKILPLKNAKNFTFATYLGNHENYIRNSNNKLSCIGVNPDANYFNYEIEKNSSMQICINFINGDRTPNIPIPQYVRDITSNFSIDSDEIYKFNCFIEETRYIELNEDICVAYEIYLLAICGIGSLNDYDLNKMTRFAHAYCSKEQNIKLASKIIELLNENVPKVCIKDLPAFFKFLFSNAEQLLLNIYDIYYDTIFEIASNIDQDELSKLNEVFDESIQKSPIHINGYLDYFISDETVKKSKLYLEHNDNVNLNLYYIKFIISKYKQSINNSKNLSILIDMLIKNIYRIKNSTDYIIIAMGYMNENVELYVKTMVGYNNYLRNKAEKELFYDKIEDQFSILEDRFIEEMERKLISNNENFEMASDLFLRKLKNSKNKEDIFWSYYNNQINLIIVSRKIDISKLIKGYLVELSDEKRYKNILKIVDTIDMSNIEDSTAIKYIIDEIEKSGVKKLFKLPLKLLNKILELTNHVDTYHSGDIIKAVIYGKQLEELINMKSIKYTFQDNLLNQYLNLSTMNKNDYKEYLERCLPLIVAKVRREDDINIILNKFNHKQYSDLLYSIYMSILNIINKKDQYFGELLIINTCSFVIKNRDRTISNELEPYLIKYLKKLRIEDIDLIENKVKVRTDKYDCYNFFKKIYKKDSFINKLLFRR